MPPKQPPDNTLPDPQEARERLLHALEPRLADTRDTLARLSSAAPQALLLESGHATQRVAVALWYAARDHCEHRTHPKAPCLSCHACLSVGANLHPDLLLLDGRLGSIKIDEVRAVRTRIAEAPRTEGTQMVVFAEAQFLGVEAANALLKVLEEPRPNLCFLLLVPQRERLLPTLVSRSFVITLPWPQPDALPNPTQAAWDETLALFVRTGQGLFAKTAVKGTVDDNTAREIVLAVHKALAAPLAGRVPSPLATALAVLPARTRIFAQDILAQTQSSIDARVNPAMAVEWLATRLYALIRS